MDQRTTRNSTTVMDVTQQGHCSLLAVHLGPNCRDLPPIYGYLNIFDKDFCRLTTSCIFFSKSKGGTWAFEASWDLEVTHFQTNPADADDHISQRGGIWMDMDGYGWMWMDMGGYGRYEMDTGKGQFRFWLPEVSHGNAKRITIAHNSYILYPMFVLSYVGV